MKNIVSSSIKNLHTEMDWSVGKQLILNTVTFDIICFPYNMKKYTDNSFILSWN